MMKIEMEIERTNWKIEDEIETVKKMKRAIERTMENFNEVTSPYELAHYAMKMKEATERRRMLEQQKKSLVWIAKED